MWKLQESMKAKIKLKTTSMLTPEKKKSLVTFWSILNFSPSTSQENVNETRWEFLHIRGKQ